MEVPARQVSVTAVVVVELLAIPLPVFVEFVMERRAIVPQVVKAPIVLWTGRFWPSALSTDTLPATVRRPIELLPLGRAILAPNVRPRRPLRRPKTILLIRPGLARLERRH
jgi:hypothetical protein